MGDMEADGCPECGLSLGGADFGGILGELGEFSAPRGRTHLPGAARPGRAPGPALPPSRPPCRSLSPQIPVTPGGTGAGSCSGCGGTIAGRRGWEVTGRREGVDRRTNSSAGLWQWECLVAPAAPAVWGHRWLMNLISQKKFPPCIQRKKS